ncbi:hypothetical protein [Paenibacillus sp. SYP-B3998]|uniref:hypothetical protein n=1 Tax=Paenibacillus sp. SYP-B3998 TaxID=2678564 RepID=UPI0013D7BF86|nr:hypothetical protein [Paenibacillus sp. SYP-B3998]
MKVNLKQIHVMPGYFEHIVSQNTLQSVDAAVVQQKLFRHRVAKRMRRSANANQLGIAAVMPKHLDDRGSTQRRSSASREMCKLRAIIRLFHKNFVLPVAPIGCILTILMFVEWVFLLVCFE